jgi:broad specificity phosphatase PhoE
MRESVHWMMRHGLTAPNANRVFAGRTNVPLVSEGRAESRRRALMLPKDTIEEIITSPLARALQTAKIVSRVLGDVHIIPDARLTHYEMGALTGQPYFQASAEELDEAEGAEGIAAFYTRHVSCVRDHTEQGGPKLFVVHGLGARMIQTELMGLPPYRVNELSRLANSEIVEIDTSSLRHPLQAATTTALAS